MRFVFGAFLIVAMRLALYISRLSGKRYWKETSPLFSFCPCNERMVITLLLPKLSSALSWFIVLSWIGEIWLEAVSLMDSISKFFSSAS